MPKLSAEGSLSKEVLNAMIRFADFLKNVPHYPDDDQLAAINADRNCVVSAGAGSGKTMVLSYRFVRLVLERKARFDQILTLTFTRKAAREMHERIHSYLAQCSGDEEIRSQLATFNAAPISTIDAFCAQIVKASAYEYGLNPTFQVDDEANLTLARRAAIELLETTPQSRGAALLSSIYSPDVIIGLLLHLSTLYPLGSELSPSLPAYISDQVRSEYERLLELFKEYLGRFNSLSKDGNTKTHEKVNDLTTTLLTILQSGEEEALWHVFTTNLGYFNKVPANAKTESLVEIRESQEEYLEIRQKLGVCAAFFLAEENLTCVVEFVRSFLDEHRKSKRSASVVSFADISRLAVKTLTDNKELRAYYKEAFRYIMIDEFQDNNEEQKQLLYLLAEKEGSEGDGIPDPHSLAPDKLFFVGDEKQSIYRFRGSDVSVFKALADELQTIGGMSVQLPRNYRSEPALIQWFNDIFPSIMADPIHPFEAKFESLEYRQEKDGIKPTISLAIKPYQEEEADDEEELAESSLAEAYYLAKKINQMLNSDEYLILVKGELRRPQPHDIAILLRSTSSQLHFERALRLFSIPYTVQMARSLFLEAITNDFYAFLQLILYPADTLSYAVILRSPFCFISDDLLPELLRHELFTIPEDIQGQEQEKLLGLKSFFETMKEAAANERLERLIFMLWYESGYHHYFVQHPRYHAYIEHYELLYRVAQQFEEKGKTLSDFLDYLRLRLGQNERLEELDLIKEKEEGVVLMSVHKSKGLEFPIVIVANAGSKGRGDDSSLALSFNSPLPNYLDQIIEVSERGKERVVKNVDALFDEGITALQEAAELKRLFYVAVTRAETHLVISGSFNKQNRKIDGARSTFLLLLCQALGIDPNEPNLSDCRVNFELIEDVPTEALLSKSSKTINIAELASWYEGASLPYKAQSIRFGVTTLAPKSEFASTRALPLLASDSYLLEEEYTAHFGTFVHRLIEAHLKGEDLSDPLTYMENSFKEVLPKAQLETIVADAKTLTQHFIDSPLCQEEVLPYPFEVELGFFSRLEHEGKRVVAEGAIDLLVDQKDRLLVIDFKSDRFVDEETHRFQIETYIDAAERLYKKPAKGLIAYLRDLSQSIHYEGRKKGGW